MLGLVAALLSVASYCHGVGAFDVIFRWAHGIGCEIGLPWAYDAKATGDDKLRLLFLDSVLSWEFTTLAEVFDRITGWKTDDKKTRRKVKDFSHRGRRAA